MKTMSIFVSKNKVLKGEADAIMVMIVAFGSLLFISIVALIWSSMRFVDFKNNFSRQAEMRQKEAVAANTQKLEEKFAERERSPFLEFVGPDDLGSVAFSYPKTWSQHIVKDGQPYEVYFHPVVIRPTSGARYALRILIEDNDYVKVISKYEGLLKSGKLTRTNVMIDGQQSTRLDGAFTNRITGAAVIFKVRDKTVTMRTDIADADYIKQFDELIKRVKFNK